MDVFMDNKGAEKWTWLPNMHCNWLAGHSKVPFEEETAARV